MILFAPLTPFRLILRSRAISAFTRVCDALWRGVSKDGAASSFETRSCGTLLRTRPRGRTRELTR